MKPGDQDGDGRVGYHDFAWLIKASGNGEVPEEGFDKFCEEVGAINKLLTKDQLYASSELIDWELTEFIEETLDKLTAFEKVESQTFARAHTHKISHRYPVTETHAYIHIHPHPTTLPHLSSGRYIGSTHSGTQRGTHARTLTRVCACTHTHTHTHVNTHVNTHITTRT